MKEAPVSPISRLVGRLDVWPVLALCSLPIFLEPAKVLATNRLIMDFGASPITSARSALASDHPRTSVCGGFANQTADGSALLVRFILAEDAEVDGAVDFVDLLCIAPNYNVIGGDRTWFSGDFTYDGNISPAAAAIAGSSDSFEHNLAAMLAKFSEPLLLTLCAFPLLFCCSCPSAEGLERVFLLDDEVIEFLRRSRAGDGLAEFVDGHEA
jgi:hypothetical protein